MDVRIRDLPETTNLNNDDVIPVDTVDVYTAKATLNTLKQFVLSDVVSYYGDESTITLNNLSNTFSVKAPYLPLSGGTVDRLTLTYLPSAAFEATPKTYVDTAMTQLRVDSDLKYALATDIVTYYGDESTITLNGLTNTFSVKAVYLPLSGGTVDRLILANLPVSAFEAAPKTYVDSAISQLSASSDAKYALSANIVTYYGDESTITLNGLTKAFSVKAVYLPLSGGTVNGTLAVAGSATFNNNVNLSGHHITNQSLHTKMISVSDTYTLTQVDNGTVIAVSGLSPSSTIVIDGGLTTGFNTTLICTSVSAISLSAGLTTTLNSLSGALSLKGQYGVCRIISYDAGKFIATGDLA